MYFFRFITSPTLAFNPTLAATSVFHPHFALPSTLIIENWSTHYYYYWFSLPLWHPLLCTINTFFSKSVPASGVYFYIRFHIKLLILILSSTRTLPPLPWLSKFSLTPPICFCLRVVSLRSRNIYERMHYVVSKPEILSSWLEWIHWKWSNIPLN